VIVSNTNVVSTSSSTSEQSKFTLSEISILAVSGILLSFAIKICLPSPSLSPIKNPNISLGENLLITQTATSEKKAGIQAMRDNNYREAIQQFQRSLLTTPDDPETYVYLNNARSLIKGEAAPLRIAASLPIGKNPTIAQEMLRGIAQAQDKINGLGIDGVSLEVILINDNNDPKSVGKLATILAQDPKILAVIGSNDSSASIAGATIYQANGITMISPTSFANKLSNFGPYIFRTIPNLTAMADRLADHAITQKKAKRFAICFDSSSVDNVSVKGDFVKALNQRSAEIVMEDCDMNRSDFNPEETVRSALSQRVDAMMISPHIDRQPNSIALIKAVKNRIPLFSTATLYTSTVLPLGGRSLEGLTLVTPWHPEQYSSTSFLARAEQKWGKTSLTWRTALSFDATQAIATAIQQIPPDQAVNRSTLQQQLRNPGFIAQGAGKSVQFLPTGDRDGTPILVQVQADSAQTYQFIEIAK
jgi:branched-chain amino acid transport system substrate-binding protein